MIGNDDNALKRANGRIHRDILAFIEEHHMFSSPPNQGVDLSGLVTSPQCSVALGNLNEAVPQITSIRGEPTRAPIDDDQRCTRQADGAVRSRSDNISFHWSLVRRESGGTRDVLNSLAEIELRLSEYVSALNVATETLTTCSDKVKALHHAVLACPELRPMYTEYADATRRADVVVANLTEQVNAALTKRHILWSAFEMVLGLGACSPADHGFAALPSGLVESVRSESHHTNRTLEAKLAPPFIEDDHLSDMVAQTDHPSGDANLEYQQQDDDLPERAHPKRPRIEALPESSYAQSPEAKCRKLVEDSSPKAMSVPMKELLSVPGSLSWYRFSIVATTSVPRGSILVHSFFLSLGVRPYVKQRRRLSLALFAKLLAKIVPVEEVGGLDGWGDAVNNEFDCFKVTLTELALNRYAGGCRGFVARFPDDVTVCE